MLKKICLPVVLLLSITVAAQTTPDKHVVAMQHMMMKLIMAAPGNFANIKGAQESQQGNAVFYKANLAATVSDPAEMKEALANDFFGAMQTADDHIVVTPEGTIYLARYIDDAEFSITGMVIQAFTTLPANAGKAGADTKLEKIPGSITEQFVYIFIINSSIVAKLNCDTKAGTAALIIGVKK